MKTRRLDPAKSATFWQKAERFAAAAKDAQRNRQWDPAVSAAIHAAINAVDALCVRALGLRAAGEDHNEAVDLLAEIRSMEGAERTSVVRNFKSLLAANHLAEYEDRLCDAPQASHAVLQMVRLMGIVRPKLIDGARPD